MFFAIPIVGKILAGAAASEVDAASATQAADPRKASGGADSVDFTQTVDNLDSAAGAKAAQHGTHAARS
ncbi:MAG: hypothetical protein ACLPSW_14175 [Roseiarcus sp.]